MCLVFWQYADDPGGWNGSRKWPVPDLCGMTGAFLEWKLTRFTSLDHRCCLADDDPEMGRRYLGTRQSMVQKSVIGR